jgi:hypothetical protein
VFEIAKPCLGRGGATRGGSMSFWSRKKKRFSLERLKELYGELILFVFLPLSFFSFFLFSFPP